MVTSHYVSVLDEGDNYSYRKDYKIFSLQNGVALLFVAFNWVLNFLVLAIIHERVPEQPVLPDISFDVLPETPWAFNVTEYIISIQSLMVILLLLVHRYRVILFRRLCIINGIIFVCRAICIASTQVPQMKPGHCTRKMTPAERATWTSYLIEIYLRVFRLVSGIGLSYTGKNVYCGDAIFSGHTVTLTFCHLFLREYLMPKIIRFSTLWSLFHALSFASSLAGVILILAGREHYLIDVLAAYFITSAIFYIYHTLVYNKSLRYANHKNYISRFWWWYLMKYLEYGHVRCSDKINGTCSKCENAVTEVPRKFHLPALGSLFSNHFFVQFKRAQGSSRTTLNNRNNGSQEWSSDFQNTRLEKDLFTERKIYVLNSRTTNSKIFSITLPEEVQVTSFISKPFSC